MSKNRELEIFGYADKVINKTRTYIRSEFQRLATVLPFDELNYIDTKDYVTAMFNRISKRAKRDYERIIKDSYNRTVKEVGGEIKRRDYDGLLIVMFGYNVVTQYVYRKEIARKRDRLVEALMSTNGDVQGARNAIRISMNLLTRQVREYSEQSVGIAREQAFKDLGVKKVEWVAEADEKTCEDCMSLNGKIFSIESVPDAPHYNCRCYIEQFITDDEKSEE